MTWSWKTSKRSNAETLYQGKGQGTLWVWLKTQHHLGLLHDCDHGAAAAKSLQSYPTLCGPIDGSPPGSPVPGIVQARTLEWVAISFSSAWKWKVKVKSLSCVQLSDPMDCSLAGSSVCGIFQARVLEFGAIAFSMIMGQLAGNSSHNSLFLAGV